MTSDPQRLLDSDAAPLQRELLTSLRSLAPPAGADAQVWHGLSRQIALSGLVGASLAAPSAASATSAASSLLPHSFLGKLLVGVGLSAAGVGTAFVGMPEKPQRVVGAVPSSKPSPAAATPAVNPPGAPEVCEAGECTGAEPADSTPAPATRRVAASERPGDDSLARESTLLVRARAALRAGNVAGARAALAQLEARFPRGMLGQEREVLNIELLAARGDRSSAERRAKAFISAYPNSPHAAKLARFVGP